MARAQFLVVEVPAAPPVRVVGESTTRQTGVVRPSLVTLRVDHLSSLLSPLSWTGLDWTGLSSPGKHDKTAGGPTATHRSHSRPLDTKIYRIFILFCQKTSEKLRTTLLE